MYQHQLQQLSTHCQPCFNQDFFLVEKENTTLFLINLVLLSLMLAPTL